MVGDLTVDRVKQLMHRYFEPIPAHAPPRPVRVVEPEQPGQRKVYACKEVASPNIMMSYHAPETKSEDYHAMDLLNAVLSEGNSSRLYRGLVDEKQLAVSVFSDYSLSLDPYLISIFSVAAAGVSEKTARR
jgi:zinc protease